MRISLALSLLLAAASASAQAVLPLNGALPDFDGVSRMGRAPGATEIKYTTDDSGAAQLPRTPPSLTEAQLQRVVDAMAAQGVPDALAYRVINVMAVADIVAGAPISRAEWDRRVNAFVAAAPTAFPSGSTAEQYESGVDRLLGQMISRPEDPHTQYLDRASWTRLIEATRNTGFVGIGAHVGADPAGVKITRPLPGGPAASAVLRLNGQPAATGLRRGDVITEIDGVSAAGVPLDQAVARLRGVPNSNVRVKVQRGGAVYDATIPRRLVQTPNSFSRMAAPRVGYVYFSSFVDNVDADVFARIDALRAQGATRLILDVRGNPGGSLPMVQSIASEFLRDGQEITTTRARNIVISRAVTDGDGRYKDMQVAVLIDTHSASASEILAGVLQDHSRATVIGYQSYGKGTFQSVIPTEIPVERFGFVVGRRADGTGAKITGGGWYGPSGRSIQGRHDPATGMNVPGTGGVRPDVVINVSAAEHEAIMDGLTDQVFGSGPAAAHDPALAAAIQRLR
jgi:C-terminal peptidase prc